MTLLNRIKSPALYNKQSLVFCYRTTSIGEENEKERERKICSEQCLFAIPAAPSREHREGNGQWVQGRGDRQRTGVGAAIRAGMTHFPTASFDSFIIQRMHRCIRVISPVSSGEIVLKRPENEDERECGVGLHHG